MNYLKEYYQKETHDLSTMLNTNVENDTKIQAIKRTMAQLQKDIELKSLELHSTLEKMYSNHFVPKTKRNLIKYRSNKDYSDYYFDLATGLATDNDNDTIYNVDTKTGEVDIVVGYNYELASIITRRYKYSISRDNNKITTKLMTEYVISFMEDKSAILTVETGNVENCDNVNWSTLRPLESIKDNEFINTMYGVNYEGGLDLKELRQQNLRNKSFEIILKTAPTVLIDHLIKLELKEAQPIHKILGVSLETYNKALERNVIMDLYDNRLYISGDNKATYGIKKTESEWFELIDEMKHYEEDLQFYNVDYSYGGYYRDNRRDSLLSTLLQSYSDNEYFKKFYTFNKFANFVINETINQGYNRVRDFISELSDYLRMCVNDNIRPTLYSSYLRQTHDITSRNHKIKVEQESEEIFKSKYEDFKQYDGKEYHVIAPKDSKDLQKEGDTLNHCVASYIKRVIDGECLIYFLRKDVEESLITLEVRHNTIMQVKGLHNRKPTDKEVEVLKEFAKDREMEVNF